MRRFFPAIFLFVLCLELYSQEWKAGTKIDAEQLTEQFVEASFKTDAVSDAVFERMRKGGSYSPHCAVSRNELRYLQLLHVGYTVGFEFFPSAEGRFANGKLLLIHAGVGGV